MKTILKPLLLLHQTIKCRFNINKKLSLTERKEIEKLKHRIYYIKNREKIKGCYIKASDDSEENKAILSAKSKVYYQNNKEKLSLRSKLYNQNNKEKISVRRKLYYQNNIELMRKKSANYYLKRVANKWKPTKEKKNMPTYERPTETKIKKKDSLKKETTIGPETNVN